MVRTTVETLSPPSRTHASSTRKFQADDTTTRPANWQRWRAEDAENVVVRAAGIIFTMTSSELPSMKLGAIFTSTITSAELPAGSTALSLTSRSRCRDSQLAARRHLHHSGGGRQAHGVISIVRDGRRVDRRHLHLWQGGRRAALQHLQHREDDVATAGAPPGVIFISMTTLKELSLCSPASTHGDIGEAPGVQPSTISISDKAAGEQHGAIINATSTRLPMCSSAPSPTQSRRCRDDRRIA